MKMNHHKYLLALSVLALSAAPATRAQDQAPAAVAEAAPQAAPQAAPKSTKTLWASGLEDPQGIVRQADGSILVAEYGGGRIVRFSADGKKKSVAAQNLKGPTMLAMSGRTVLVAERKANRVARLNANGTVSGIGGAIEEPLGLAIVGGQPIVISHTTSKVLRWDGRAWQPVFEAKTGEGKRYGYRCLAAEPGGSMLMTDEVSGQVLMLTSGGRLATWAKDFTSPSGVVLGPDGAAYVADEGEGTLAKLAADGTSEVVASELGKPRGILFLDARTALVTDRGGNVWRVQM